MSFRSALAVVTVLCFSSVRASAGVEYYFSTPEQPAHCNCNEGDGTNSTSNSRTYPDFSDMLSENPWKALGMFAATAVMAGVIASFGGSGKSGGNGGFPSEGNSADGELASGEAEQGDS